MEYTKNSIETFEKDIYNSITNCLSDDEKIEFSLFADFILPQGCKKLNWSEPTAIEIKYRFIYDTFSRLRYIADRVAPSKLIVIVIEGGNKQSLHHYKVNSSIKGRNIDILTFNDLKKQIKAVATEIPAVENVDFPEENNKNNIKRAKKALLEKEISLFLGAGVSASAGIVTWDTLLEQLCTKKHIQKLDSEIDSIVKGRYIIDKYRDNKGKLTSQFYTDIHKILYAHTRNSELIEKIATMIVECNIRSIITYNYDNLIELQLDATHKKYQSMYDKSRPIDKTQINIYHVHGYLPKEGEASEIILGEKEYHNIYTEAYNWGNVEQLHALTRNTCFFIGLSMTDPNLRRLLDIAISGSEVEATHFVFLRKIEYNIPFMEQTMRSFGINCIWYDNHDELPQLIYNLIPTT